MKKKTIGIITFHFSNNYGSALQCYALFEVLSLKGYAVKVINYCPSYHTLNYNAFNSFKDYYENRGNRGVAFIILKTVIKNIVGFFIFDKKRKNSKFLRFIKNNLLLSEPYKYVKDIKDDCDVYISGSDQIWNYKCVKDKEYGGVYDKAYFLSFTSGKKKISYAVSAQHSEIKTDLDSQVLSLINDYSFISAREEPLTETLHSLGRTDAVTVLDPTLILEKEYYQKVEAKINLKIGDYILVYNLPGTNSSLLEMLVRNISKKTGYKIIDISPNPYKKLKSKKNKSCGPAEFLAYIHNAKYVLTDSFHAVAFSIIYNKDFNCVLRDKNDERIRNILALSGLKDRLVETIDDEIKMEPIDYSIVEDRLKPSREFSINFLLNALEN